MERKYIDTEIGKIAVYISKSKEKKLPVIFLHGVYLDHNLWNEIINEFQDRTVITMDMPWHGESKEDISNRLSL